MASGTEQGLAFAGAVFAACAVEAVEALTVVLAVGTARGWRWTLAGAAGALLTLAVAVGALGPAITSLPLDVLRLLVGAAMLVVGVQWLRKAVLRAAGRKALHDELAIYSATTRAAEQEGQRASVDRYALKTAYMGVLLEGLEVVVIVVGFAAGGHGLGVGVAAASLAVLLVTLAGVALRAPLARVPENTIKLAVGVMLVSFGVFYVGEGLGVSWPASDAMLPVIALVLLLLAALLVAALKPKIAQEFERGGEA